MLSAGAASAPHSRPRGRPARIFYTRTRVSRRETSTLASEVGHLHASVHRCRQAYTNFDGNAGAVPLPPLSPLAPQTIHATAPACPPTNSRARTSPSSSVLSSTRPSREAVNIHLLRGPRPSAPKLVSSDRTVCNSYHPRRARTPLRLVSASPTANDTPRAAPRAFPTTLPNGRVRQQRARGCYLRVTVSRRASPTRWSSDRPVALHASMHPCCWSRTSCSREVRAARRKAHDGCGASLEEDVDAGCGDSRRGREGRYDTGGMGE